MWRGLNSRTRSSTVCDDVSKFGMGYARFDRERVEGAEQPNPEFDSFDSLSETIKHMVAYPGREKT